MPWVIQRFEERRSLAFSQDHAAGQMARSRNDRHEPKVILLAWYGLGVLAAASAFAAVNLSVLVLLTEALKQSLTLSDTDIGSLNGLALSLTGVIATYPMGMLADRVDRRVLLSICVVVWSAATALCGFSHNYSQLFLCAAGIATGEAVLTPITYSLIADLFPRRLWMSANYVFYLAGVLGGSAGLVLSGLAIAAVESGRHHLPHMLATMEPWRLTMFLVATPGPVLAVLILLIPKSSAQLSVERAAKAPILAYLRANARTLLGVFLGFGLAAGAHRNIGVWASVALIRLFHESPQQAGMRLGLTTAAFSLLGVFASSLIVRRLRTKLGEASLPLIASAAIMMGALIMPIYVFATAAWEIYLLNFICGTAMITAISLSPSLLQRIAPNQFRSRVIAIGGLSFYLLLSLTPVAVGRLSDSIFTGPKGLLSAMIAVSLPCAMAGVGFLWVGRTSLTATLHAAEAADA